MASWRTRKRVGIGLFVCGIALIVLGVVIGLLLPSSIRKGVTELSCIDSKDHSQYNKWVGPSTSEKLIYHWHIANRDEFLYKGAVPKLEEKGPYVYTAETKKIDVKFDKQGHCVSYKSFTKQTFDIKRTAELCKPCKEDDKLAVLNSAYLGLVTRAGGADNFGKAFVPLMVSLLLHELSNNETITFQLLAKNVSHISVLTDSKRFNPMFGSWVRSADHHSAFNNASFTSDEMRALYGVLKNNTLFGPPREAALYSHCINPSAGDPCQSACGFLLCLGTYATTYKSNSSAHMQNALTGYLCPLNSSRICFNYTEPEQLRILATFVLNVLPAYVHWTFNLYNYGLVTTRNQSELTLGFLMKLPLPGYPNGYFIRGGLTNHDNEKQASEKAADVAFYTCKASDANKYQWAGYKGSDQVEQKFFPKATLWQRKIRGYSGQFPEAVQLKACKEYYGPTERSYEIFLSSAYVHANITYKKALQVEGLNMDRFEPDESTLDVDNVFVFKKGLIDVTNVHSFPSYMSFPRFLGGDPQLWKQLNLSEADKEKHGTFVDIEPVSGRAMNAKFRLQYNLGLNKKAVPSKESSFPEFKIKDLPEKDPLPFPVFWIEAGGKIGAKDAGDFRRQVFGYLRIACAILVSFTLIGAIFFTIGLVLMALACKKGGTAVSDINE